MHLTKPAETVWGYVGGYSKKCKPNNHRHPVAAQSDAQAPCLDIEAIGKLYLDGIFSHGYRQRYALCRYDGALLPLIREALR